MNKMQNFVSEVRSRGIAKNSNYVCDISLPIMLQASNARHDLELVTLFIEQAQFPDMSLITSTVKDFGVTREVVYDKSYGTFTLTFLCDQSMIIKTFFDVWLDAIIVKKGGIFMYPSSYTSAEFIMHQLDNEKDSAYDVHIKNIYPKYIGDIVTSSSGRDFMKFQVQFAFESWKSYRVSTKPIKEVDRVRPGLDFGRIATIVGGLSKQGLKSTILVNAQQSITQILGGKSPIPPIGFGIGTL